MRVRLTLDKRISSILREEASKYGITVNRLVNNIISSSKDIKPRFYRIENESTVIDVKVNLENKDIWRDILREYNDYSKSQILRGYIAAYLFLPIYIRESFAYRNIIKKINSGIEKNRCIEICHSKNGTSFVKRKVEPYEIITTQIEENNYLVGYCKKRKELRAFRISRILKVKNLNEKFTVREEYKDVLEKSKKYFDGFLSYGKYVKVELSEKGLVMLKRITLNRPLEISKKDVFDNPEKFKGISISKEELENDKIKVFECSLYQCEAYFFQYLENIYIIEPEEARNRMYDRLNSSLKIMECRKNNSDIDNL